MRSKTTWSTILTAFVITLTLSLGTIPVFAGSGNNYQQTNQRYHSKKQYQQNYKRSNKFNKYRHSRNRKNSIQRNPPVLDSRFPNSYKQYQYYQQQQAEYYRNQ